MEGKVQVLLEEIYSLVEAVAEGVSENTRRLEILKAEVGRIKESQTRLELAVRRLEGEVGNDYREKFLYSGGIGN